MESKIKATQELKPERLSADECNKLYTKLISDIFTNKETGQRLEYHLTYILTMYFSTRLSQFKLGKFSQYKEKEKDLLLESLVDVLRDSLKQIGHSTYLNIKNHYDEIRSHSEAEESKGIV